MRTLCGPRLAGAVFGLLWAIAAPATLEAATATLVADAHVNSTQPAVNSGSISNLAVGGGYTALLQFDLGVLPAGTTAAQVTRATLRLYANRVDTAGLVQVQGVAAGWGEYSVTYASMPALGGVVGSAQVAAAGQYVTVDVTAAVQGWLTTPASNNGLALTTAAAAVQFDSKENDFTGHAAELEVSLASAGLAGATGPAGPAGVAGSQGPAGPAGVAGPTGAVGPAGPQGATGPQGAPGGLSYQGTFFASTTYGAGAVVSFGGSSWVSLVAGNRGSAPGVNSVVWGLLAQAQAGVAGPAGPAGAQGLPGIPGLTGAQGPVGPAGADGPRGLPGLVYQGAYSAGTNYNLGNVVTWQGATYSSLETGNHGNAPDASPLAWGVLSARGAMGITGPVGPQGLQGVGGPAGSVGPPGEMGPQGLQGIAGQAGAQGIPGVVGAQGLQGPVGPQGLAGPVGLTMRGAYAPGTNYGVGDGVIYNGAGYVSLAGSNRGNAPDQSPVQWAMFAAAGAVGGQGAAGVAGAAGAQGPQGVQGQAGPIGATGATGPQGPAVANYTGAYSSVRPYGLNDAVSWAGSTYISIAGNNRGNTPDQSPAWWMVLVASGAAGATGPAGPVGAAGANGAVGPQGVAGAQGPPVSFRGGWLAGTAYGMGDAVSYAGSSYIALVANGGREPDVSPVYWGVLAQTGAAGVAGPAGTQGLQGVQGATGPQGVAGPQGAAGANGANGLTGLTYRGAYSPGAVYAQNDAVTYGGSSYLSLSGANAGNTPGQSLAWAVLAQAGAPGVPGATGAVGPVGAAGTAGPAGPTGAAGPAGAIGMNFRGAWNTTVNYQTSDAVTYAGSTYLAQASNVSVEPDQSATAWAVLAASGVAGPTGPAGAGATVAIGTVSTGAAGSTATVTNSGTASAAVLNFTIPQGAAGTGGGGGSGGGAGTSGIPFASVYHSVSFANSYFGVNSSVGSASELGGAVLTWVPNGCTLTKLMVFSQQGNTITVNLRAGPIGSLTTALSCQAASGGSCTATGSIAVAAGSFVDLGITGANGSAAGVWTAVACE